MNLISAPFSFFILLILASMAFWIIAIIEIARGRFVDSTTKIAWLLVVIFAGFVGALIYFAAGRQSRLVA